MKTFVADKVKDWSKEVIELSRFAESQPHAAYYAFTHSLAICFSDYPFYDVYQPSEDVIHQVFIPALTGCPTIHGGYLLFLLVWGPGYLCSYEWM